MYAPVYFLPVFPACPKSAAVYVFHRHQPEFSSAVVLEFDAVRNFQAVSFSDSADPARPGPSYIPHVPASQSSRRTGHPLPI